MFDRYIISGESVQTLSMDVHPQEISLPGSARSPPCQGRETDIDHPGDPHYQLQLQGPDLQENRG